MAAWLSLGASALSAGFIGAAISYDLDTDVVSRDSNPFVYGYIPANAGRRSLVFLTMLLLSGMLLVTRCLAIVLFYISGGKTLAFAYVGIDLR